MPYRLLLFFYLIALIEWSCVNKNEEKKESSGSSVPQINPLPHIEIIGIAIAGSGWYKKTKHSNVVNLKHDQTEYLQISFTTKGFAKDDSLELSWKLDGYNDWKKIVTVEQENVFHGEFFDFLKPGKYTFIVKGRKLHESWEIPTAYQIINVSKPIWWFWWFWASVFTAPSLIIYLIVKWRVRLAQKQERQRAKQEKELLELEAKALRSQMNPHFIFNCLNSIKSLIQQHEKEKAVTYLTTFSKLISTLFNNADKKEISLYEEIDTCTFYLQLEAMRFDTKFSYKVNVSDKIDLKAIQVPALIVQPFIENAIWHGIIPKDAGGHIELSIIHEGDSVEIIIDDNGIGRKASKQNKSVSGLTHQSKGVNLTQSRLELDSVLRQRKAKLKTIDKKDKTGFTNGTKVIISINEEIS